MMPQNGSVTSLRGCLFVVLGASLLILITWFYKEKSFCDLQLVKEKRLAAIQIESLKQVPQGPVEPVAAAPAKPIEIVLKEPAEKDNSTKPPWDYNWDKSAWANPEDAAKVGVRTVLLIRHGQYDFHTGKLTDMGRRQANLTGERLRLLGMPYSKIIHSEMDRARETAEIIQAQLGGSLPMESDIMLEEGGPVPPQPTITYWGLPEKSYHVDGPRLEAAFRKYFHRAGIEQTTQSYEILVAHANIFRFFVLKALQFPSHGWMRFFIAHASISLLHINPDGTVSMTKLGDAGHMPPDVVTI